MLHTMRLLRYRDEVLDHLGTLLVMYPRGRQFPDDFAALRGVIRTHFDGGVSTWGSAVQLTAAIIASFLRQLDPDERRSVLEQLGAMDWDALRSIAARRLARTEAGASNRTTFPAQLIGVSIFMARKLTHEGALHRSEYEYLLSEIEGQFGADPLRAGPPEPGGRILGELFPLHSAWPEVETGSVPRA